jgi:hypothetical protein
VCTLEGPEHSGTYQTPKSIGEGATGIEPCNAMGELVGEKRVGYNVWAGYIPLV